MGLEMLGERDHDGTTVGNRRLHQDRVLLKVYLERQSRDVLRDMAKAEKRSESSMALLLIQDGMTAKTLRDHAQKWTAEILGPMATGRR